MRDNTPSQPRAVILLAALCLLVGCRPEGAPVPAGTGARAAPLLVPATALLATVDSLPRDPALLSIEGDSFRTEQIRYGLRLMRETPRYAPAYVGNALSCSNCHLNAGQREGALPLVGVAGLFPLYLPRDGRLVSLEDRIGQCFARSMNGTPPPHDSPEMMALAAYITWLSAGQPVGEAPAWRGKNRIPKENLIPIAQLDVDRGRQLYSARCVACHGGDGQGVDLGVARPGPLWGPDSWNDGAGAARIYTFAGYIRYAMPLTEPGTLTDEEAQQIAAFVNAHARPIFATKEADYPSAPVPVDAVYDPRRFARHPLMPAVPD